jgi:transcriptional regulator with XRE-family HTH domain
MLCQTMELTFSQWFLIKRRSQSLSQDDVAAELGVTKQTVSNWERSVSRPTLTINQFKKLCKLLDCTLDDFPNP